MCLHLRAPPPISLLKRAIRSRQMKCEPIFPLQLKLSIPSYARHQILDLITCNSSVIYWTRASLPGERDTKQDTFNKLVKTSAGLAEHVMRACVGACESLICLHAERAKLSPFSRANQSQKEDL